MMNSDKFKQVVRLIVKEEISKQARGLIKEVMAEMLVEMAMNKGDVISNNSSKGKTLREASFLDASELEEYPTMKPTQPGFNKNQLAQMLGYGDITGHAVSHGQISVDKIVTETGTEIPISPTQIPDELMKAFNKDYRPLMKALEAKKGING
jgi:hypothetical protein